MRHAAVLTGPETHLDHLGVLSSILEIPLIVTEEKNFRLAKHCYPDFNVTLMGLEELTLEYLASNYDTLFETGKFFAAELKPVLELLFHKKMCFVFCPHGNSDKGYSLKNHVAQDISLVYGDHLHDLLKQTGAADKIGRIVRTGNYRYSYYLKHKNFFDALADRQVFSHFKRAKPTVLYAPTWNDAENPTSFFDQTDRLIEELSPSYNLLIKLHPFLLEDHPSRFFQILGRYENDASVLFLTDFPPIYPLLARCALYLGDYSSIGYDFLAFDKPLYFLNPKKVISPLHSCGLEVPKRGILKFLESDSSTRFAEQRKKIYTYTFGKQVSREEILKETILI